jgi:hypothetical protein
MEKSRRIWILKRNATEDSFGSSFHLTTDRTLQWWIQCPPVPL